MISLLPINPIKRRYPTSTACSCHAVTTAFHAYATAVALHKGHRYTLRVTYVRAGEPMKNVVQRIVRKQLRGRYLLLDKGFCSVAMISYLKRAGLLFVGIALVLRNAWVWLHYRLAKHKSRTEPPVCLALLRFSNFLLWITQVVQRLLGADQSQGIDYETYERLMAKA